MAEHPITPPPDELVDQWRNDNLVPENLANYVATQAARWGADQELEACCAWLIANDNPRWALALQEGRRPKPPSLKEQALEALDRMDQLPTAEDQFIIRRALEALDD